MSDARATGTWLVADETKEPPTESAVEPKQKKAPIPGFYAGTAKEVIPPPRSRRRPVLLLAIGLVGAAAAGAVGAVVLGGGDEDQTANATTTAPSTTAAGAASESDSESDAASESESAPESTAPAAETAPPAPSTSAAAGGAVATDVVEVGEPGWYVSDDQRFGSYGFAVENTSDRVLGSFVVRVKAYDRSGRVISGSEAWKHVIGTMQPYQEVVVADELHNEAMAADGISRLDVEVAELSEQSELSDDATFAGRPNGPVPDGTVAVGDVERSESLVRTRVTYRAASSYDVPLDADAYLVLRDAEGTVIGGASSFVDLPAQGTVAGDFDVRNEIISPDTASIEVHVVPRIPL
ncbi:MAG TPA: hypothetical protein VK611_15985 [Acidimicrobiales bacterium]|nr:hypothetical protein [Acidimicrobiales bacterium]